MMEPAWWRTYQRQYRKRRSPGYMLFLTLWVVLVAGLIGQCVLEDEREMQKDMAPISISQRSEVISRWRMEVNP